MWQEESLIPTLIKQVADCQCNDFPFTKERYCCSRSHTLNIHHFWADMSVSLFLRFSLWHRVVCRRFIVSANVSFSLFLTVCQIGMSSSSSSSWPPSGPACAAGEYLHDVYIVCGLDHIHLDYFKMWLYSWLKVCFCFTSAILSFRELVLL